MKEMRFFYQPHPRCGELPAEEAKHAVRVLRLATNDEIYLADGAGNFYRAVITEASNHHCRYAILATLPQQKEWNGEIHLAVAPTKNMDRMEWLTEKMTEIGFDTCTFLHCRFSERKAIKTDRLEKIVVAAMKQSHKAFKPELKEMQPFQQFIQQKDLPAHRYIAHCYDMKDVTEAPFYDMTAKPLLHDLLDSNSTAAVVLIGPEGDFSIDEVKAAHAAGFQSVSLGTSRLRTETAALVATHLLRINA